MLESTETFDKEIYLNPDFLGVDVVIKISQEIVKKHFFLLYLYYKKDKPSLHNNPYFHIHNFSSVHIIHQIRI